MPLTVLRKIPFRIDADAVLRRLHMGGEHPSAGDVRRLAGEAERLGNPKGVYGVARIESRNDDSIVVEGVTLTSLVLRVNVEGVHRIFPFVATCGVELAEWGDSFEDPLLHFAAESIEEMVLGAALARVFEAMEEHYQPGRLAMMNPGSLPDWPLPEQRPLFRLLGDVEGAVGVRLTDSFLMVPAKSVSGLRFPTETAYENCQLCDMRVCPGRRAPYEPGLYQRKYKVRE